MSEVLGYRVYTPIVFLTTHERQEVSSALIGDSNIQQ